MIFNTFSGWYYADSNNEYPIFDGSRCYIACPNGSFIRVECFWGAYDENNPYCFQNHNNGIFALIGLWNTEGPDAELPFNYYELERLRNAGIDLLYDSENIKYPLKLTSSTGKKYEELPPSKYSTLDAGNSELPMETLSRVYSSLSECYRKILAGDTKYEKCKTCYCHFLGLSGDCRNPDFKNVIIALHEEQRDLEQNFFIGVDDSPDSEKEIHRLELAPYEQPDWFFDCGISEYKRLFASPIPGIDSAVCDDTDDDHTVLIKEIDAIMQRAPSVISDLQTKFSQVASPTETLVQNMKLIHETQARYSDDMGDNEKEATYERLQSLIDACSKELSELIRTQRKDMLDSKFAQDMEKAKADLEEVKRKWNAFAMKAYGDGGIA